MSRKPIFLQDKQAQQGYMYNQPNQIQTGRQADTRIANMKSTEHLLMAPQHNSPFSALSTAMQSQDASFLSNRVDESNVGFQQIVKHVNQMIMEKSQAQELKIKELQNQIDSNRTIIFDIRGQNPINAEQLSIKFKQFEESIRTQIKKAQEELMSQQVNFQNDYQNKFKELQDQTDNKLKLIQKDNQQNLVKLKEDSQLRIAPQNNLSEDKTIKDIQQKIKDLQLLFDSQHNEFTLYDQKTKQQLAKLEKNLFEQSQKISVQEEQTIAQFKTFQNNQQNNIAQASKKLSDDIEIKLQQVQNIIQQKTFSQSDKLTELTLQQADLNKITQGVFDLQNSQKLLSQQYQELTLRIDQHLSQNSKQEIYLKQLEQKVDQNKDENDNGITQLKLELSSLTKQFERIKQEYKNQFEYLQDLQNKSNEEIRKSHQELLFSFKQTEQTNWIDEYNKKKPEIQQAQVQVFNYEEDSESKSDQQLNELSEQNNIEQIEHEFEKEAFMDKLKALSPSKNSQFQEEKIVEVKEEDQHQKNDQKGEDEDDDEENEATYQLDENGFLLDDEGNYLLDENGQMIQLNETQIEYLRKQDMVQEEDN
ncbi:unnamed protein product (macronuclear) [Paramecium tetraurelia]|uniref:Uncharacterized protein n=1 Tax=Paramecium tetraurelia TaxID=5888 RepID=A0C9N8_PARTE|nr:uncharacterized protein GSPATT00006811001 [Paramecium tetraurelia]CAK67505.1 unnamed protein product [Paramecium tetraurelia]|eukprot:XP_001434902.1 hypothetical protein (macronuclear) [Paramecium tetraurelia strain d4-2]